MAVFAGFGVNFYEIKFANKISKIVWKICFHLTFEVAKENWQILSANLYILACVR